MNNKWEVPQPDSQIIIHDSKGTNTIPSYNLMKNLKLDKFPELKEPAIALLKRVIEGDEQLSQTQAFVIGHLLKEIE